MSAGMALAAHASKPANKDKWKAKAWSSHGAAAFNNAQLAETLADEPDKLRAGPSSTLNELTGDMSRCTSSSPSKFFGADNQARRRTSATHDVDYIRRLTRRGNSKSRGLRLGDQDGSRVRVKLSRSLTPLPDDAGAGDPPHHGRALTESARRTTCPASSRHPAGQPHERDVQGARKVHPLRRIEIAKSEISRRDH